MKLASTRSVYCERRFLYERTIERQRFGVGNGSVFALQGLRRPFTTLHGIRKPRIMRFFREYFGYPFAREVFKVAGCWETLAVGE